MKLSRIASVSLLAATLFAGLPVTGLAHITEITIRVDGLSCPFCAYSLEKHLKNVENAETPVIDVKEGTASVTPTGDDPVDIEALRDAVKKAGFTPREVHVEGNGHIETIDGRPTLLAEDGTHLFALEANETLAGITPEETKDFEFTGVVLPRGEDEDESELRTLALVTVTPYRKGENQ